MAAHEAVLGGGLPPGPARHLLPVSLLLGGAHVQRHGALPRLGALGRLGPRGGLGRTGGHVASHGHLWPFVDFIGRVAISDFFCQS